MFRGITKVAVLLAACIAIGCSSSINLEVRRATPLVSERNTSLLAGVGRADITPRPGMPMAGYSANANYGKGFRTRLFARVIYLKPVDRGPVALVQCDLLTGSELVHRRVAELVADKTDLDLRGIMLSATHTHSGPGNLSGSNFYLMNTANAGGLDMKFFDFVTGQIAAAIIDAYNSRRPARIATGSIEAYGFTRNRSISAYRANLNADPVKARDIRKAVNPMMYMVRIDCYDVRSGAYVPAGAFTSFSIHGTTVPSQNILYNADVFAYIERELEWEMARKYRNTGFVHAVVNGTHADNAPDIISDGPGYKESRRLGVGLGRKAIGLFNSLEKQLSGRVKVGAALREVDYYRNNTVDGIAICDTPRVGNTLLAGAYDGGPTPILNWLPFFKEGSKRWIFTSGCHGNRRIALWPFQSLILPRDEFPHRITFQAIWLGDIVLLPLPYEVTMESGRRIAETCRKSAIQGGMPADTRFVVVSVSNGYTGYSTTPEEYAQQRYEAGHTLYGPNTNPFITAQAARVVGDLVRQEEFCDNPGPWMFRLTEQTFYRKYDEPQGRRQTLAEPELRRPDGGEEHWLLKWADVPPTLINLHRCLVSIEYSEDGAKWFPLEERGISVDDDGYDLSVTFTGELTGAKMGIYETRWFNPEKREGRWYRFRIEPRQGQEMFFSKAFKS
ncbi:MAG: alkaline ceramidase [Deltaproteobacteria bacterium]|nr:alkaline ceramidase [Deltaproteobacteria bacterium]